MSDTATAPETVSGKWDATFRRKPGEPPRQFSWHSAVVQRFMRDNYLEGTSVSGILKTYLDGRTVRRGLEIGGGLGRQAISFHRMLGVEKFDVMDISSFAVETGNRQAAEQGLNVEFLLADLNNDPLPEDTYDLIVASGSLHHIENLEHLFAQIRRALRPGGVFFANDYMGPSYMQWTEPQLSLMNALLSALPEDMTRTSHRGGAMVGEVTRIPLAQFAKNDPSEGVRAAEIFDVMEQHLVIRKRVPIGQTLLYELLRGRIQNFDDDDPKDRCILDLMCLFEKTLLDRGILTSDFNVVIAEARP